MTIAPDRPMLAACDCDTLLVCGHCACDRCGDCYGCTACGCACTAMERAVGRQLVAVLRPAVQERRAELYLGTHMINWLWSEDPRFAGRTQFVSYNRFIQRKTPFPRALHAHCRDSGGFTHLKQHGRWIIPAAEFVANHRRWDGELGPARWIAPRDWMCEPWVIFGKNQHLKPSHRDYFHGTREARGIAPGVVEDPERDLDAAVLIHQRYTVDDYLELKRLAPELPIIPVLQGWTLEQYQRCADMYAAAGVDLTAEPVVGLGSVCRRQATDEIQQIVRHFAAQGLRLHGFGVKTRGLGSYADGLVSADSMAWSDVARKESIRFVGHPHKNCANCPDWALMWHEKINQRHLGATAGDADLALDFEPSSEDALVAELADLKAAMAVAHPDRGGTDADFIRSRKRYETARASLDAKRRARRTRTAA